MMASMPDMAFFPKIVLTAAACSSSESPRRDSLVFSMTPARVFMLPYSSTRLIPYFFMAASIWSVGAARLEIAVRSEVPAMDPLTPAFAIRPSAMPTSSME